MRLETVNKKFTVFSLGLYAAFILVLLLSGYFSIGLLSDDYLNFYDTVNSSLAQKFTGNLPYSNHLLYRPVIYLSFQVSYFLHDLLGFSYDNFVLYRIQNLFVFLLISFVAGKIILLRTNHLLSALLVSAIIIIFPNNIHNICWTSARVDLLCGLFYLLTILFTFLYLERPAKLFLILSVLTLTLSLLTKETAVTVPVVVFLFALYNYEGSVLKKNKLIFIVHFSLILVYALFRLLFLNNDLTRAATLFQDNPVLNIPGILARAVISFTIPVDFLSLNVGLRNRETVLLLYLLILYTFIIYAFVFIIRSNAYKQLLYLLALGFLILFPYMFIGYLRPQMILIPFVLLLIQIFLYFSRSDKMKSVVNTKFVYLMIAGFILFWTYWSVSVVRDWKFVYEDSMLRLEPLLKMNLDNISASTGAGDMYKQVIVIGNPSRLKQSFMFNKLTGAYNFWKYKEFTIKETFNDIVQTAALDRASINSKLKYEAIPSTRDEFVITVTGGTQFFTMEGFDNVRIKSGFRNKDMTVEFTDFNVLDKPTKLKLKILSPGIPVYILSEMNYIRIN